MKMRFTRGLSLVDTIVGVALLLVVFVALFGMFRASIALTNASKARSGATALATEQMEYIRSLTYANTGTVGGIPPGTVPPESIRTLNGRDYTIRTFIQYVDDPADGEGGADVTGIITDYKKVKVDVTYEVNGREENVSLVSNRTPKGIETTEGGGNLRINVIDALGAPVSSAQVSIQNPNTDPVTSVVTFTGSGGYVFLPGAATSTGYRVSVSRTGYSSAQTYDQDASNVSPDPGHLTVVEAETTQNTFAIDVLSSFFIYTYEPIERLFAQDTFADASKLSYATSTETVLGNLVLENELGVYESSGIARSTSTSPTYLHTWQAFHATTTTPLGTTIRYFVQYDNAGIPTLIPDAALAGNSVGFTSTPIDLSSIATTTYSTLYVETQLETSDTDATPQIDAWRFTYDHGPVPIPNVPFALEGSKTIGEDSGGSPIKKHTINAATGPAGWNQVLNIEWDLYDLQIPTFDIVELCDPDALSISPNSTNTVNAFLQNPTDHSLRVLVRNDSSVLIDDATVSVTRTGYSEEDVTGACGQTYFGDLQNQNDYTVTVSKGGFITEVVEDVVVSGDTVVSVVLTTS